MPKKIKEDSYTRLLKSLSKRELATVQPGLDEMDRKDRERQKAKKKRGQRAL